MHLSFVAERYFWLQAQWERLLWSEAGLLWFEEELHSQAAASAHFCWTEWI